MGKGGELIRLLFEVGHLYHRAALDPLYKVFSQDAEYEIEFACTYDVERRLGVFNRSLRSELESRFQAEGLTIAGAAESGDDAPR